MKLTPYKLGDFCRMKYGKMPPKDVLADEGFPVFSGYRITGYAKECLYDNPRVIVVARGVGGTGDVKMSPEKSWIRRQPLLQLCR
ncbi:MAG: restriction endonuclease subunit S [Thermodesulfobacteriota bacterium]|nr:restriction endonuclease subunit S [Thermodesulfobacteriota bacterium]